MKDIQPDLQLPENTELLTTPRLSASSLASSRRRPGLQPDRYLPLCGINPQNNQGFIQRPSTCPGVGSTDPEEGRKGEVGRVVVERFGARFRVSCVGPGQTCRVGSETVPVLYG